jgi:hypothetical protein
MIGPHFKNSRQPLLSKGTPQASKRTSLKIKDVLVGIADEYHSGLGNNERRGDRLINFLMIMYCLRSGLVICRDIRGC